MRTFLATLPLCAFTGSSTGESLEWRRPSDCRRRWGRHVSARAKAKIASLPGVDVRDARPRWQSNIARCPGAFNGRSWLPSDVCLLRTSQLSCGEHARTTAHTFNQRVFQYPCLPASSF